MRRILLLFAAIEACTPSSQEAAMRRPSPTIGITDQTSGTVAGSRRPTNPGLKGQGGEQHEKAAQGAVPAGEDPAPALPEDSPAEAQGRRTLSTAFVRVGPDGHLTVELRSGRVLVIRDVIMRAKHYDGVQVFGGLSGTKFRGAYADVATARPGGAPASDKAPGDVQPGEAKVESIPVYHPGKG